MLRRGPERVADAVPRYTQVVSGLTIDREQRGKGSLSATPLPITCELPTTIPLRHQGESLRRDDPRNSMNFPSPRPERRFEPDRSAGADVADSDCSKRQSLGSRCHRRDERARTGRR